MKGAGLDKRDLFAMIWVALAATVFGVVRAGVDVPGMHHERVLAGTLLALGALGCGAGARDDAVTSRGVTTPFVAVLRAFGVVLLAVGVGAVVLGRPSITAVLLAGTVAMWIASTARHALTPVSAPPPQPAVHAPAPRTKEMSS